MQIRTVEAGGAAVAVREWGSDGPPIVFWHSVGPGGSGAMFAVAAEVLAGKGFTVAAPDAPGFGRSPAREPDAYGLRELGELVWEIADGLGYDRPVVSGHSWGGAVAVAAAGVRPDAVRALVLYDSGHADYRDWPGADLTVTREQLIEQAARDTRLPSWDDLVTLLREEELDQPWMLDAWREAVCETDDGGIELRVDPTVRGAALYALTYEQPSDFWPAIAAARIPTLVLLATEPPDVAEANDRLVQQFLKAVPHAEVLRLEDCRHQIFADLGPRSGEVVADWLARQSVA
jgi:pimeloyl-ACP methyl ester carboxylesterase